jgi:hypothetical protein
MIKLKYLINSLIIITAAVDLTDLATITDTDSTIMSKGTNGWGVFKLYDNDYRC